MNILRLTGVLTEIRSEKLSNALLLHQWSVETVVTVCLICPTSFTTICSSS